MAVENAKVNILVAFPYFKKAVVEAFKKVPKENYRLIVDSGAFTAWNTGKTIELDEYCRFLDSINFLRPFNAVQLDVFGDPEATWKNFLIMKSRGYDVMPVFTRGDSLERLEEMYSYTDYIMFGGITIGGKNQNYIKWFMEQNKGRKVHWLGFCNVDFVKYFAPYSIDSSSWSSAGRFGNIRLYAGYGKSVAVQRKKFLSKPEPRIVALAKRSGIEMKELLLLQHKEAWIDSTNIPDLKKPERRIAMMMSAIGSLHQAIDTERNIGTKVYTALCTETQLHLVLAARDFLIERKIINGLRTREQRTGLEIAG